MLRDSYSYSGTSARQSAFVETPRQKRARVDFLQHKKQGDDDRRIETWVKEQAFVAATNKMAAVTAARSRGHRRNRLSVVSSTDLKDHLVGEDSSPLGSPRKAQQYYPAAHITPIPEDEESYFVYSTPLIVQPRAPAKVLPVNEPFMPYSAPASSKAALASSRSSSRHQPHLSDLGSIPEEQT
ncbi:hypothetical protein Moror_6720 [Moniliophthora roreri MCA 2997]|uniref:Uncharacterized protein n=1 Tax=Moniliophthora roreri (strain MCA 2997) TaxID=1381753 RepID=V2XBZ9_MONRO|nr:hypothetical protein Moror_6720 [Moniliophthora roreri MCA 2997]